MLSENSQQALVPKLAWGAWVALAMVLCAVELQGLFLHPVLRALRIGVVVAASVAATIRPRATLAAIVALVPAATLVTDELLGVGGVSLVHHALPPACLAALLVAGPRPVPQGSGVRLAVTTYLLVAAFSSVAAFATAIASAHGEYPDLGIARIFGDEVVSAFVDAFAISRVFDLRNTVWASSALVWLCSACLWLRVLSDPEVGPGIRRLTAALAVGLGALAGTALFQWMVPFNTDAVYAAGQRHLFRPDSIWSEPNGAALHAIVVGPAVAGVACGAVASRWSPLALMATTATVLTVALTNSRGAMGGLYLAAMLGAAWVWRRALRDRRWGDERTVRRVRSFAAVLLVVPFLVTALITAVGPNRELRYRDASSRLDVLMLTSDGNRSMTERLSGRPLVWRVGWDMWRAHPWTGVGIGQAALRKQEYASAGRLGKYWQRWHGLHHAWLETAAELGLFGLAALFAIVVALVRELGAGLRSADRTVRLGSAGVAIGLTAMVVASCTIGWVWRRDGMLVVVSVMALGTALAHREGATLRGASYEAVSAKDRAC